MADSKRRRGRPLKPAKAGERASLGLRVSGDLKHRIDQAAQRAGRTQGQEAELRLERSFHEQELLPQILDLAYGRRLAGMLMLLGREMRSCGLGSWILSTQDHLTGEGWFSDAYAYDQVVQAVNEILEQYRPSGDPNHTSSGMTLKSPSAQGKGSAQMILDGLREGDAESMGLKAAFERLGPPPKGAAR
jgi:hypothetical protein